MIAEIRRRRRAVAKAAEGEKRCPRCKMTKPRSAFGRHVKRPDGLQGHCKECRRL